MEKIGFFEESAGSRSFIRLQMFMTLLFSFIVIGYQVYHNEVDYLLALTLLTTAVAPKVIQKFAEIQANKNK